MSSTFSTPTAQFLAPKFIHSSWILFPSLSPAPLPERPYCHSTCLRQLLYLASLLVSLATLQCNILPGTSLLIFPVPHNISELCALHSGCPCSCFSFLLSLPPDCQRAPFLYSPFLSQKPFQISQKDMI